MWRDLSTWTEANGGTLSIAAAVSLGAVAVSALALPWLIARMPADYFARTGSRARPDRPAWMQAARLCGRNALGAVIVCAGLAMLVLPGQGILTIVAGLLCMQFPAKRRVVLRLARRPAVLRALNWVRRRTGRQPFAAPPPA